MQKTTLDHNKQIKDFEILNQQRSSLFVRFISANMKLFPWVLNPAPVAQTLDSAIQRISIGETNCTIDSIEIYLAPVVQKMDNAIHRVNHYPLQNAIGFPNTCPLDSGG